MLIKVRVKLYGASREAVGARDVEIALPEGSTVAEVLDRMQEIHPQLHEHLPLCSPLVNRANVDLGFELSDGDVVSCVPRMSGGSA